MANSFMRTSKDGTLLATLGKSFIKTVTFTGLDIKGKMVEFPVACKEISFNIVPSSLTFYIDKDQPDHAMTINTQMSVEAEINMFYITGNAQTVDTDTFEIWLWK